MSGDELRRGDVVVVEWADAVREPAELRIMRQYDCDFIFGTSKSVGFVLKSDVDHLVLSQNLGDYGHERNVCGIIAIPTSSIKTVTVYDAKSEVS